MINKGTQLHTAITLIDDCIEYYKDNPMGRIARGTICIYEQKEEGQKTRRCAIGFALHQRGLMTEDIADFEGVVAGLKYEGIMDVEDALGVPYEFLSRLQSTHDNSNSERIDNDFVEFKHQVQINPQNYGFDI